MSDRPSLVARFGEYFAVGSEWQRPVAAVARRDVALGVGVAVVSLVSIELSRGVGYFDGQDDPRWIEWAVVVLGCLLLVLRRRLPLTVAVLAALHMFVVGVTMPAVMSNAAMQVVYFVAFYSAVAWARDRAAMAVVMGLIVTLLFTWLAWQFAVGNAIEEVLQHVGARRHPGWLSPAVSSILLSFLVNVVYFGGAAAMGQVAWRGARQHERLAAQAATIASQSEDLQRRAVVEERLRIARELHDVVAHHVSVIGIQAAAGRRVLDRDPDATKEALTEIEGSSREAVTQMRDLLGTLRATDPDPQDGGADVHRAPAPGVEALADLVAVHDSQALRATYDLVEEQRGGVHRLPAPVGLSLYRTAQEALTNVTRHSTATAVDVVLRVHEEEGHGGYAEVEVIDNGRPRRGSSGSGLGQLGIRERVASLRGEVEIGPRVSGGYRVRVRLPLGGPDGLP